MNKKELIDAVAQKRGLTKKEAEILVDTVFDTIIDTVLAGDKVLISGFGTFRVHHREERKGVSPKTKEMISVLGALNITSKALVVTAEENTTVELSTRNIPGVKVLSVAQLNVLDLLDATKLVITQDAVKKIEEVLA